MNPETIPAGPHAVSVNGTRPSPTAELVTITPDLAAGWLDRNTNNRNVRPRKVSTYAAEILRGDWVVTGEGVKFDWDGRLIDGQHRLMAVVEADAPVQMFVFHGLAPDAQLVLDTGTKRTAADALKFAGVTGCGLIQLAAAARIGILWTDGLYKRSGSGANSSDRDITSTEVVDWVAANPDAIRACARADLVRKSTGISASVLGFAWLLFARIDEDDAERFFADVTNMRTTGQGDPIFTLLRRIRGARDSKEKLGTPQLLFFLFRTWNAWRQSEPLHQLKVGQVRTGGGALSSISIPEPV